MAKCMAKAVWLCPGRGRIAACESVKIMYCTPSFLLFASSYSPLPTTTSSALKASCLLPSWEVVDVHPGVLCLARNDLTHASGRPCFECRIAQLPERHVSQPTVPQCSYRSCADRALSMAACVHGSRDDTITCIYIYRRHVFIRTGHTYIHHLRTYILRHLHTYIGAQIHT